MSKRDDGGGAFPWVDTHTEGENGEYRQVVQSSGGMTLRDYFAAKAMQALIASPVAFEDLLGEKLKPGTQPGILLSAMAYVLADDMLKVRSA